MKLNFKGRILGALAAPWVWLRSAALRMRLTSPPELSGSRAG